MFAWRLDAAFIVALFLPGLQGLQILVEVWLYLHGPLLFGCCFGCCWCCCWYVDFVSWLSQIWISIEWAGEIIRLLQACSRSALQFFILLWKRRWNLLLSFDWQLEPQELSFALNDLKLQDRRDCWSFPEVLHQAGVDDLSKLPRVNARNWFVLASDNF